MLRRLTAITILFAAITVSCPVRVHGEYVPTIEDVTVPGSGETVTLGDGRADPAVTTETVGTIMTVETGYAAFDIDTEENTITCRRLLRGDGYSTDDTPVVTVSFGFPLAGLVQTGSEPGYAAWANDHVTFAVHSDATLWIHTRQTGPYVAFTSHIHGPDTYDRGGIGYVFGYDGGYRYPVDESRFVDEHDGLKALARNWMAISGDRDSDIGVTGGFGVYTRPVRIYRYEVGAVVDSVDTPDYWPVFMRESDREGVLQTSFDTIEGLEGNDWRSQCSFIVSIFPCRVKDDGLKRERLQQINPASMNRATKQRTHDYVFPSIDNVSRWAVPSYKSFNFRHTVDGETNDFPITGLILFEGIWRYDFEMEPPVTPIRVWTPIPYTPVDEQAFTGFLNDTNANASTRELKVILYISALADYNHLDHRMPEDEYFNAVTGEIRRLVETYPVMDGFYIDTLPLDGVPGTSEPLRLAYSIMRWIREEYGSRLTIILHSSENPIGPKRLRTSSIHNSVNSWAQFEIYAPFIDRYADYVVRGEAYPIDIAYDGSRVLPHVSEHIRFVVDPTGKSNAMGMLVWTRTGSPITSDDDINAGRFNPDDWYYSTAFPASIDRGLPSPYLPTSSQPWYTFDPVQGDDSESRRINRLVVMDAILDSYSREGHIAMKSQANQNPDNVTYWMQFPASDPPPGQTDVINDGHEPTGASGDIYRSLPLMWRALEYGVTDNPATGVDDQDVEPAASPVINHTVYPNPANASVTIEYKLSHEVTVEIRIHNMLGQQVRSIEVVRQPAGLHRMAWDCRDDDGQSLASGQYFYRIEADSHMTGGSFTLIR